MNLKTEPNEQKPAVAPSELNAGLGLIPPRKPKGLDYRDSPQDMEPVFLLDLTLQVYCRASRMDATEELHNRAFELRDEIARRLMMPNYTIYEPYKV